MQNSSHLINSIPVNVKYYFTFLISPFEPDIFGPSTLSAEPRKRLGSIWPSS